MAPTFRPAVAMLMSCLAAATAIVLVAAGLAYEADLLPATWRSRVEVGDRTVWLGIAAAAVIALIASMIGVLSARRWWAARLIVGGSGQRAVLRLEPSPALATVAYSVLAVVALAVVSAAAAYRSDRLPASWRSWINIEDRTAAAVMTVAGCLALLLTFAAVASGRHWHTIRALRRLSDDPALAPYRPPGSVIPPRIVAAAVPPLDVRFVKPKKLPKPDIHVRAVSAGRNLIGLPPPTIAYLRLFENEPRARTFLQGAWREFGYINLLRSVESVSPGEYRWAKRYGHLDELFVNGTERLRVELERQRLTVNQPGRHTIRTVAGSTVRVRDKYGSYPLAAVLCHGSFWRSALDVLLERAGLVVLDLSGLSPRNVGTRYELQRVIDRFPVDRLVLLADPRSDRRFLEHQLHEAWRRMDRASPNAAPGPKQAVIAITDVFVDERKGSDSTKRTRLLARRRETRRLATWAQLRARDSGTVRQPAPPDPHPAEPIASGCRDHPAQT